MVNKIKASQLSLDAVAEMIANVSNGKRHHEIESTLGENSQIVKEHHADRKDVCEFILQKLEKAYEKLQKTRNTGNKQSSIQPADETIS